MAEHEYYREEWMTEDQFFCFQMLCDVMGGGNHLCGKVKPRSRGIELSTRGFRAATFDYDGLTKAVILAHDRFIRFEVEPSGPGMLKLVLFRRQPEGRMYERHPTLEEAIAKYRETSHA
ncbi:hypothetical protein [Pantoea sp. CTOTU49201]|uniref:hypothetical protein n=1 Tax=Pantoea sp. CTOTU49201 TaxID=2953855 RepID=UPI00289B9C6B|nr:hypothetical protein [Pantoea sp. CTOTU49201]